MRIGSPEASTIDRSRELRDAIASADRLTVERSKWLRNEGGRGVWESRVIMEERDAAAVQELINHLMVEPIEPRSCRCIDEHYMKYHRGTEVLAETSLQHSSAIRWRPNWKGDISLLPESRDYVAAWLAQRGVREPQQDLDNARLDQQWRIRQRELATSRMPEIVKKAFLFVSDLDAGETRDVDEGERSFIVACERAEPPLPVQAQITLLLRALGTVNTDWWRQAGLERRAMGWLREYRRSDVVKAAMAAAFGGDRLARRGAVRLWLGPKPTPHNLSGRQEVQEAWEASFQPMETAEFYVVALTVLTEARCVRLRDHALQRILNWVSSLPPQTVIGHMRMLLRDPDCSIRREAMLACGRLSPALAAEFTPYLMHVLGGAHEDVLPLSPVPEDEEFVDDERPGQESTHFLNRDWAGLALGYANYAPSKPLLVSRTAAGSQMCEVALALLGEPQRLMQRHFGLPDEGDHDYECREGQQALQLAAVEAVVRCKGVVGLDLVTGYRQVSHWWEPYRVTVAIGKMLVANGERSAATLANLNQRDLDGQEDKFAPLKKWYKAHGGAYARKARSVASTVTTSESNCIVM